MPLSPLPQPMLFFLFKHVTTKCLGPFFCPQVFNIPESARIEALHEAVMWLEKSIAGLYRSRVLNNRAGLTRYRLKLSSFVRGIIRSDELELSELSDLKWAEELEGHMKEQLTPPATDNV